MQKRLLFKIGYVCKIPWGEEGMTIWPTVYYLSDEENQILVAAILILAYTVVIFVSEETHRVHLCDNFYKWNKAP